MQREPERLTLDAADGYRLAALRYPAAQAPAMASEQVPTFMVGHSFGGHAQPAGAG